MEKVKDVFVRAVYRLRVELGWTDIQPLIVKQQHVEANTACCRNVKQ